VTLTNKLYSPSSSRTQLLLLHSHVHHACVGHAFSSIVHPAAAPVRPHHPERPRVRAGVWQRGDTPRVAPHGVAIGRDRILVRRDPAVRGVPTFDDFSPVCCRTVTSLLVHSSPFFTTVQKLPFPLTCSLFLG